MTPYALGDPPRPAHPYMTPYPYMTNHVVDVLRICHNTMEIGQMGIDRELFSDGFEVSDTLDAIMGEA